MNFTQILITVIMGGILFWAMVELQNSESERKRVLSLIMFIPTCFFILLLIGASLSANNYQTVQKEKVDTVQYEIVKDTLYRKIDNQ